MNVIKIIGILLLLIILIFVGVLFYLNLRTQTDARQQTFLAGQVPSVLPDGFYQGQVNFKTTWQGKKFDRATSTGINIFQNGSSTSQAFPFKTYVGKGAADRSINVLKIDYNIPQNPVWMKFILDEVVETQPGHFLGKVELRFLPNLSLALGYFQLQSTRSSP